MSLNSGELGTVDRIDIPPFALKAIKLRKIMGALPRHANE